jgi:hypothetical protein
LTSFGAGAPAAAGTAKPPGTIEWE